MPGYNFFPSGRKIVCVALFICIYIPYPMILLLTQPFAPQKKQIKKFSNIWRPAAQKRSKMSESKQRSKTLKAEVNADDDKDTIAKIKKQVKKEQDTETPPKASKKEAHTETTKTKKVKKEEVGSLSDYFLIRK